MMNLHLHGNTGRRCNAVARACVLSIFAGFAAIAGDSGDTVDIQAQLLQGPEENLSEGEVGEIVVEFTNVGTTTERVGFGSERLPEFETPFVIRPVQPITPQVCAMGITISDAGISFSGNVATLEPQEIQVCRYEYEVTFVPSTPVFTVTFARILPFDDEDSSNDQIILDFRFAQGGGSSAPISAPVGGVWFGALLAAGLVAIARIQIKCRPS